MMSLRETLALVGKIVALAVVLLVVQGIGSRFLPAMEAAGADAGGQPSPPPAGFLGLVLCVCLLQTVALAYPVVRSRWHGWRLTLTVFLVFFGPGTFMGQVESMIYLRSRLGQGMLSGIVLMGLFSAAVFSPIVVWVLGKGRAPADATEPPRLLRMSWKSWAWRLAAGAAVYLTLYYLFGYFVAWKQPAVREFYGGTDPGTFLAQMRGIVRSTPWMVPFQSLRGLLWVLLALPVIRMMEGRWWEAGLAVSLLFTAPVAYLLFPNPLMPEMVRMAHMVETAPYQFLFGWLVVWLFTRPMSAR
jgi:hypothetical protein